MMATKLCGEIFLASFTTVLHFLFAFSVTEQVFITNTSGDSSKGTLLYPFSSNILEIVEVSEKLSLQPKVWKATFFAIVQR